MTRIGMRAVRSCLRIGAATAVRLADEGARLLVCDVQRQGLEATAKALATGTYFLISHRKLASLGEHPESIPTAVLEVLRFSPPAQNVARYAPVDMVCQDVALHAGQVASANIVAACRDPRRYVNPDELDITRHAPKQLAFGAGPHYCLGVNLAKAEMQEALSYLAPRMPDLRLDGEPVYGTIDGIYGLDELRASWSA